MGFRLWSLLLLYSGSPLLLGALAFRVCSSGLGLLILDRITCKGSGCGFGALDSCVQGQRLGVEGFQFRTWGVEGLGLGGL